jgi:hypothetical protein
LFIDDIERSSRYVFSNRLIITSRFSFESICVSTTVSRSSANDLSSPMNAFAVLAFAIVLVSPSHAADSCDKIRNILSRDNRVEILDFSNDSIVAAAHNFSGSMTIICGSGKDIATDLTIGVNTNTPDKSFMAYFGDLAHRITGVNAKDAQSAAEQCYKSALGYKGTHDGLFYGDQINTKTIHTDCRVDNNFTSSGVFSRRGMPGGTKPMIRVSNDMCLLIGRLSEKSLSSDITCIRAVRRTWT